MIVAMSPSPPSAEQSRPARAELLCLAGAILLGAILRLSFPGRMAIEHFDEGVYASNFWFGAEEGYEYPARHLYAPPLLPAAIEWTMIIASLLGIRPTGFVPMIPSLLAGLATIPSIWWVGRRWFGPSAGIVSAWLVAASDFHSSYSRAALTDVPVCLFILWGVYFTWLALQTGTRRDIILAAVFTALAWWTKYNGWLPLAIGLSGGMAWQLAMPLKERQLVQFAKRWLLVAGLSFVLWSPVLIGLQKYGGYRAVAANHKQYVEGLAQWPTNAARQLENIAFYESPLQSFQPTSAIQLMSRQTGMLVPRWVEWIPTLLIFLGTVACCLLRLPACRADGRNACNWLLLAWICGMTVATPAYYPYPRLAMPWLTAAWLGVGLIVEFLIRSDLIFGLQPTSAKFRWKPQWLEAALAVWLIVSIVSKWQVGGTRAWEDRSGLARAVASLIPDIRERTSSLGFPADESIVYVMGMPAAIFQLKEGGLPLVAPVPNLQFLEGMHPRPTYFLFRSAAMRQIDFIKAWESNSAHFRHVWPKVTAWSSLVVLDGGNESVQPSPEVWLVHVRD
eukprot:TRINITY_DN278_c0_g1_i2.p1 TRINITY_DN278_c0_g1~~TRINITY_DN278_c0_g1_i2.p1  ORF type:complete len:563 (+),score=72.97 TRINITY_DN278_c0_g1_i2:3632-5320(+)